jgi:tRNA dimethylallyltransferase
MSLLPLISEQTSIIFIVGATASGKSQCALNLAKHYDAIIINADALQIYQDLSIITARPTNQEIAEIPHYLYGFLSINQHYNVAQWCVDVQKIIHNNPNKKVIIVGGTGLYFKTLINGIAPIPDIPQDIRQKVRLMTNQALFDALSTIDVRAIEKLHRNDTNRLSRAYEVILHTGKSIYDFQQQSVSFLPPHRHYQGFFLNPNRSLLYERIHQRFDIMIEMGVLQEVAKIAHYDLKNQAMKAVGVIDIIDYLNEKISLEQAIHNAKQASRHYAKRQLTFFNNQFPHFVTVN